MQMKWMPIETAPKDGSWLLLLFPEHALDGHIEAHSGFWSEDGSNDWFGNEAASHSLSDLYGQPSHWMPLSPPPTSG